ncbi:MAG: HPF/RaiA family ribosome-associated protein [Planctomycetota bacterium]|jgi:ribosome-associated translation inhibitor RaiA
MNLQVYELNIRPSDVLRAHVEQRFHTALARILRQVSVVVVRFADVNGPRGGPDKRCDVQVRLLGGQTVRIRETGICFYRTVDRAARRARRVVKNRLRRRRAKRRSGPGRRAR